MLKFEHTLSRTCHYKPQENSLPKLVSVMQRFAVTMFKRLVLSPQATMTNDSINVDFNNVKKYITGMAQYMEIVNHTRQ